MNVPLALLGLLEREPSHGYDLKRDYDTFFGRGKPLPFGQVYATLGRLARDGKVIAADTEPGAGPDRKRYVITDDGVSELESWLAEPVAPEPHLQTVLFVKVVLALMSGRSAGAISTPSAPPISLACASSPSSAAAAVWSMHCWPTTACFTSRPTCAGSI